MWIERRRKGCRYKVWTICRREKGAFFWSRRPWLKYKLVSVRLVWSFQGRRTLFGVKPLAHCAWGLLDPAAYTLSPRLMQVIRCFELSSYTMFWFDRSTILMDIWSLTQYYAFHRVDYFLIRFLTILGLVLFSRDIGGNLVKCKAC